MQKENNHRKNLSQSNGMIYGKIPPQAKDVEEVILGACLIEKSAIDRAVSILGPESFYVDAHQIVFRAMLRMQNRTQAVDVITVVEELKRSEELDMVGGPYFLAKLTNSVVSAANIEQHCRIVLEKFIQREIIRVASELITDAYQEGSDPFELLNTAEESILSIGKSNLKGGPLTIQQVLTASLKKIEEYRKSGSAITGIPSGFESLDKVTRGWQDGDLIILAARPSIGKTAMALSLARSAGSGVLNAKYGKKPKPVAIWSLEMKSTQLMFRMLSAESEINLHRIQTGRLDDEQMKQLHKKGVDPLTKYDIFFDDESGLSISRLRAKARRLKQKNDIGLIILDYMQLMDGSGEKSNREQEIAKISRGLKLLAQELSIPIISLSQLSREVEKRSGAKKIPQLSDLRESGAIEQDADVVVFLWGPDEDEIDQDKTLINRKYARVAKQRNGMLLTLDLDFQSDIQLWKESGAELQGNWKQIPTIAAEPNLFIQSGSRMRDDDEPDSEMPF